MFMYIHISFFIINFVLGHEKESRVWTERDVLKDSVMATVPWCTPGLLDLKGGGWAVRAFVPPGHW